MVAWLWAGLLLAALALRTCEAVVQASDVQSLLLLRNAVENWGEFSSNNSFQGWSESVPACTWTGITCSDGGEIVTLSWQCESCAVRAIGKLPPDMARITTLTTLNLQSNSFYGTLPTAWGDVDSWPSLQNLYLSNNNFSGTLPAIWGQAGALSLLEQLRIENNRLTGTLPANWGAEETSIRQLLVLRLSNNSLTGSLPPSWGTPQAFPNIQVLSLRANSLTGTLPELWSNPAVFKSLQELYLDQNDLRGELPPSWGEPDALPGLRFLSLAQNPLGGSLPSQWGLNGSFPSLRTLGLNDSALHGTLPPSWGRSTAFAQLDALQLERNDLSGTISGTWGTLGQVRRLIIKPGNDRLCGPLPDNLTYPLCDDRDLSCLRIPVRLSDTCGPIYAPEPEVVFPPPKAASGSTSGSPSGGGGGGGGSSTAAIVGGVVGGVCGALLLAALAVCLVRSRHRKQQRARQEGAEKPSQRPFMTDLDLEDGRDYGPSPFMAAAGARTLSGGRSGATSALSTPRTNNNNNRSPSGALSRLFTRLFSSSRETSAAVDLSPGVTGGANGFLSGSPGRETASEEGDGLGDLGSPAGTAASAGFALRSLSTEVPWSDWEIDPAEIELMRRPDGSTWELGSGGFGRVYKALRNGAQVVAVKVIPARGETRQAALLETRKEVSILRACRDPNIVMFQGAHLGPDNTLLVTEYMEGGNLLQNLAARRVSWYRRGRRIALDVAKGLVFLHSRRIVHFDLKSPNILLARDGTAKVADVGLAKIMNRDYISGVTATLAWSAPEMLWGAKCTEKVDIYSFGIVLWEICSGEAPERGRLRDVLVPEECPAAVRDLMLQCLESRPSMRPTALQLVERLLQTPATPPAGVAPPAAAAPPEADPTSTTPTAEDSQASPRGSSNESAQPPDALPPAALPPAPPEGDQQQQQQQQESESAWPPSQRVATPDAAAAGGGGGQAEQHMASPFGTYQAQES